MVASAARGGAGAFAPRAGRAWRSGDVLEDQGGGGGLGKDIFMTLAREAAKTLRA